MSGKIGIDKPRAQLKNKWRVAPQETWGKFNKYLSERDMENDVSEFRRVAEEAQRDKYYD